MMTDPVATADAAHIPVMLQEMLAALAPADGETYVDGTFGAGGYSRAILAAAECKVAALDRDQTALDAAKVWQKAHLNLTLLHGRFGDMAALLRDAGIASVDGIVLDIGVSSMQLDQAQRGFSFRADGPLDMRMDQMAGQSAADLLAGIEEEPLANLIYQYGEERHSRRIARAILRAREDAPLATTRQLADIVRCAQPPKKPGGIDPSTRTFQALRIAVNDELGELQRALAAAERLLRPGGRLVVVTFHSLEDGIVKRFLAERSGRAPSGSRHLPDSGAVRTPSFTLHGKAEGASDTEAARNPRARSARLRAAIRTAAPAWTEAQL